MRASRHYDQDILIAEYTLGLLTPQETAHVHTLMASDSAAAVTALKWESSFLQLVDALEPVAPSPHVLQQVQTALGHSPSPPSGRLLRPAAPPAAAAPALQKPPTTHTPIAGKPRVEPVLAADRNTKTDSAANTSATLALQQPQSFTQDSSTPSTSATPASDTVRARDTVATSVPPNAPSLEPTAAAAPLYASETPLEPTQSDSIKPIAKPLARAEGSVSNPLSNLWNSVGLWRFAVIVLAIACAAFALKPDPPLIHITETAPTHAAVLLAPGTSSTPGWVLTIDTGDNVLLTPQVATEVAAENTVQLWTQNTQDASPRSLGLIDVNRPIIIKADDIGRVQPSQLFEMTLEPQGGSATGQPSGPVLFIGRVVLFGSPEPTAHDATSTGAAS